MVGHRLKMIENTDRYNQTLNVGQDRLHGRKMFQKVEPNQEQKKEVMLKKSYSSRLINGIRNGRKPRRIGQNQVMEDFEY